MTLDKHKIEGIIAQITSKVLPADNFDDQLLEAGYAKIGTATAQGNRIKSWWTHPIYPRVESIYSPDGAIAITASHI